MVFYAISAIFRPYNGMNVESIGKICSPLVAMVTSPLEWKFSKSTENNTQSKQAYPIIWKNHNLIELQCWLSRWCTCISCDMLSLSDRTSDMALVPRTFLRVVAARRRVDFWASWTLHTAMMGSKIRKYTTASTATVTESLVRIYSIQTKNKGNNLGELMSDTTVTESLVRIFSKQKKKQLE